MKQVNARFGVIGGFGGSFGDELRFAAAPEPEGEHDEAKEGADRDRPRCENAGNETAAASDGEKKWPDGIAGEFEFVLRRGVEKRDGEDFAFFGAETGDETGVGEIIPESI